MRLIDADAYDKLLDHRVMSLMEYSGSISGAIMGCRALLAEQPTVDAKPVVHGRWERFTHPSGTHGIRCDSCKERNGRKSNYCPNCGARMDTKNDGI